MTEVKCMGCGKVAGGADELAGGSFVWVCSQQCKPNIYSGPIADVNAELEKRWAASSDAKLAKETIAMLEAELERTRGEVNEARDLLATTQRQRGEYAEALLAGGRAATAARKAIGKMPATPAPTLDGVADALEPGQSIIVSRVADAQRAELAKLEMDGAWTVTIVASEVPGGDEECTLFVENERDAATKRAHFYITGKNQKAPAAPGLPQRAGECGHGVVLSVSCDKCSPEPTGTQRSQPCSSG